MSINVIIKTVNYHKHDFNYVISCVTSKKICRQFCKRHEKLQIISKNKPLKLHKSTYPGLSVLDDRSLPYIVEW